MSNRMQSALLGAATVRERSWAPKFKNKKRRLR